MMKYCIEYYLEVRMADRSLSIDDEKTRIIAECINNANKTPASEKSKRFFSLVKKKEDCLHIKITSPIPIDPLRSMSTLTREVARSDEMQKILKKDNIKNGRIFKTRLLRSQLEGISDEEILSEIEQIFSGEGYTPGENEVVQEAALKIREIFLTYVNKLPKGNLR